MDTVDELNGALNTKLIHFLRDQLGKDKVNKTALCREMGITTSVLYKRLSGHSQFTLGELGYIMRKYNLSFDSWIWKTEDKIEIILHGLNDPVASIEDFLRKIDGLFKIIKQYTSPKIYYATREMPLFYYFLQPKLGAFKLYIFAKFIWKIPGIKDDVPFSMDLFSNYIQNQISSIWQNYSKIPSQEIWNPNVWDNTLQQVLYLLEIRGFDQPTDALEIIDAINKVVDDCSKMAKTGKKIQSEGKFGAPVVYYNNRITHTNNIIIAGDEENPLLFVTHDNPNYFSSDNKAFINYTRKWMNNLKEHAEILDSENQANIDVFFRNLQNKIELTKRKAKGLISRDDEWI
jgi:hypothetical protein